MMSFWLMPWCSLLRTHGHKIVGADFSSDKLNSTQIVFQASWGVFCIGEQWNTFRCFIDSEEV